MRRTRTKRYRVVSKVKFILSTLLIAVILTMIGICVSIGVNNAYKMITNKNVKQVERVYTQLDIIAMKHTEQAKMNKLNTQIMELRAKHLAIEKKYKKEISRSQTMGRQAFMLYKKYEYAINFDGSDVTLEDLKMVEDICRKYNKDPNFPHLWWNLIQLESGYNSQDENNKSSAKGWGQLLAGTGKYVYEEVLKLGKYDHTTMALDKNINATLSIKYLSDLISSSGVERGLINYNGNELGPKYVRIISSNLKKNVGISINTIRYIPPNNKK